VDAQRLDLSLDPLGVPQQQIALFTRFGVPNLAVGLVGAHIRDSDAHRTQTSERLQGVDVVLAVPPVPAARITGDRTYQPDLFVVAQRRLAQPGAPGYVLDSESCHASSKTHLKRLKSSPDTKSSGLPSRREAAAPRSVESGRCYFGHQRGLLIAAIIAGINIAIGLTSPWLRPTTQQLEAAVA
jgi:hypothetical protein